MSGNLDRSPSREGPVALERPEAPELLDIKVWYFGAIKKILGVDEETLVLQAGSQIRELIAALAARHGPPFLEAIFAPHERLLPNAMILLDGDNILHGEGFATTMDGRGLVQILLMPPFVGGG